MVKADGGPAYPSVLYSHERAENWSTDGMSLRDWFAGQADVPWNAVFETLGHLGEPKPTVSRLAEYRAHLKYVEADAMLAARDECPANPLQTELDQARAKIESLESLRPHWAQGYSSDSIAAQTATAALSQLWRLLGVPHQTAAVEKLRSLVGVQA